MNFYVDFEALQFSGRIISIGCINDNGDKFYTLSQPSKQGERLTNFITDLTGITNEMLSNAPTANEAFENFYQYVKSTCDDTAPQFYCYGNCDGDFLRSTGKYLTSFDARMFCNYVRCNLTDYSSTAQSYFPSFETLALKKIYSLIKEDNEPQHHNALEDAEMLCVVMKELCNHCTPEDSERLAAMPSTKFRKPKTNSNRAPEVFINWPANKMEADTGATKETNWQYKWSRGNKTKYFDTFDTMVMWAIKYITQGRSIKNPSDVKKVEKQLSNAIISGSLFMNCKWEKREVEFIG